MLALAMLVPLGASAEGDRSRGCVVDFHVRCPVAEPGETPVPPGRSLLTIVVLAGVLAGVSLGVDAPETPRWSAGNGFDDGIRDGLVGSSRSTRDRASTASDVLLAGLGAGLLADWIGEGRKGRYAWQNSALTDSSWILGDLLATQSTKVIAGRQRPYVDPCRVNPRYVSACGNFSDFNTSFFSGHASLSATFAGLLCARHLSPVDRDAWDWSICGSAAAASLATGLLRITADRHHASDVFVGWAVGAAFGYVLPRMFDYRGESGMFSRVAIRPVAERRKWGMTFSYVF